jgi:thiamine pyrophosphate-dependent acetolactate synthase large subunit-like protein
VFNDGQLNQIRQQQLGEYGHAHAVSLGPLDLQGFAEAAGLRYTRLEGDGETSLIGALATAGPVLLDVPLGDSVAIQATRAARVARNVVRDALGPRLLAWLKRWRG